MKLFKEGTMNRNLLCALGFLALLLPAALILSIPVAGHSASAYSPESALQTITPTPGPTVIPEGIDLDVTYISRTPLYHSYCVEYPNDIPRLCPGTENDKRWPDPGEVVTFTAHIINKGTLPCPAFDYAWAIDGVVLLEGTLPGLNAAAEITTTYQWPWTHPLVGERTLEDHTVRFTVDPDNTITETYETNNSLEDDTRAMSFHIGITPAMVAAYNIPVDPKYPWSAEDWLQKQIAMMNANFARSTYPTTPNGATQRVRINSIEITSTPIQGDNQHDGGWFVDADYRHGVSAWYDPATDIDWALIHELSHQVGMIDLYMSDIPYDNVLVLDRSGRPSNFGFTWPNPDLMAGGDIYPHTDHNVYSSHSAGGVSTQRGYRNGYYGVYQYDIPLENYLRVVDQAGNPVAGVQVALFQRNGPYNWLWQPTIDNTAELTGTTGADGTLLLANRSANGGTTTHTGHVLHDNPFGLVDFIHTKNRFLGSLRSASHEEFFWLDITAFNLAYWAGDTISHTYTITSYIPVSGAPEPPVITSQRVEADRVTLCWSPGAGSTPVSYRVYRANQPVYTYQPVSPLVSGPCYQDIHVDEGASFGGFIYAVTALDASDRQSGFSNFAWAGNLDSPAAIAIRPDGDRLVLNPNYGYALLRQQPDGRYSQFIGYADLHLELSRFFSLDASGNLLLSHPGDYSSTRQSVILADPTGKPILEFGKTGTGDGEFQNPAGVASWGPAFTVEGPYQDDPSTLLLLHFDGSYQGTQGELGVPSGTTFAPGRYSQGVQIGLDGQVVYRSAGNLNPAHGSIEFWVKPEWNGDDGQSYTFFEAGNTWYNRFRIMKDGANNLRFMSWDNATEYGVVYNVASWRAGEWHHVAAIWQNYEMAFYVDGTSVGNDKFFPPVTLPGPIIIGASLWHDQHAQAVIDELRISDSVRLGNSEKCNRFLVVDSGNHRVQAFDYLGKFLGKYGSYGSGIGNLCYPQGLAVDSRGRVLVADACNSRVVVLGFDGATFTYQASYSAGSAKPSGVAVDAQDRIYIADGGNDRIVVLGPDGRYLAAFTAPNDGYTGTFSQPSGVAVQTDGTIVVADTGNRRVVSIHQPRLPSFIYLSVVAKP
jgi:hypothetical protein